MLKLAIFRFIIYLAKKLGFRSFPAEFVEQGASDSAVLEKNHNYKYIKKVTKKTSNKSIRIKLRIIMYIAIVKLMIKLNSKTY